MRLNCLAGRSPRVRCPHLDRKQLFDCFELRKGEENAARSASDRISWLSWLKRPFDHIPQQWRTTFNFEAFVGSYLFWRHF